MPENKFDSGHIIVPIVHPETGEVHNIAVPEDTDLADLHSALADSGYAHPALDTQKQPTKEGALEYSDAFRKAAGNAVAASRNFTGNESGFAVDAKGQPRKTQTSIGSGIENAHHLRIAAPWNTMATLHTHPTRTGTEGPSADDIQNAKNLRRTVYVASSGGLYAIDPGGSVSQVFKSPTWYSDKGPK